MASSDPYKIVELPKVVSYLDFGECPDLIAQLIDGEEEPPYQKLGTLGYVNKNGQEVAIGALDAWMKANSGRLRIPMYAQHNRTTVPGGSFRDLEIRSSQHLYGRPYITPTTSVGRDILASLEAGDISGISWTVGVRDRNSYMFRERRGKEPGFLGMDRVMVVTDGILVEASVVYQGADPSARFRSKKVGDTTARKDRKYSEPVAAAVRRVATRRAVIAQRLRSK